MKFCPTCGYQAEDSAVACPSCGALLNNVNRADAYQDSGYQGGYQSGGSYQGGYQGGYYNYDPADHTSEFDAQDIAENKVIAMVPYLLSYIGIIIALLASHSSKYVAFHVRQALKLTVVEILVGVVTALLCWTVIVPVVGGVCMVILFVLHIIAFFQVCSGKAKEPAIIRSLKFLK